MDGVLAGQSALITGASRGIGFALATAFVRAGANVMLVARSAGPLETATARLRGEGGDVAFAVADVLDEGSVGVAMDAVTKRWGGVDTLVNNAGVIRFASIVETSVEDWDVIHQTNVRGTFLLTREALRRMDGGVILNVASSFGITPVKGYAAYCASKAAILHLTRVAALEGAATGVRVNAIAPGYIATDLNADALADDAIRTSIERRIPMQRVASPEELCPLAVHLCSSDSSYMTGAVVTVDGGFGLR